jgi:multidrug resistance protein, MATE family
LNPLADHPSPVSTGSLVRELLATGAPIFIAMAGYTAMMFADTYMLSFVGDADASAAAMGGAVSFVPLTLGFGALLLVNTLVSQAFGRGDRAHCGRYLWQGLWIALIYGIAQLPLCFVAKDIFRALGHPEHSVPLSAVYFQTLVIGAVVKLAGTVITQFLIGVNRSRVVAIAAGAGVAFNFLANYALIYGEWGFPKLGVLGSAIATVASTVLELVISGCVVFGPSMRKQYATADLSLHQAELLTILKLGIPAGLAMLGEVGAWTAYNAWVMPRLGEATFNANNYAFRYMLLAFMPAVGFGHAVTTLVGRYIGRRRPDVALRSAHLGMLLAGSYMVVCGSLFAIFGAPLMRVFTQNPELIRIGAVILVFMGLYQILDAAYVVYNGGLRGAGDTRVPAVVMIVLNWTMVVGLSWLVVTHRPEWGVVAPYVVLCVYGTILGLFMLIRFQLGRWRRIDLSHVGEETAKGFEPAIADQ